MNTKTIAAYKIRNKARQEELVRVCWQYADMRAELSALATSAPELDGMPRGTSIGDPVYAAAVRREKLAERVMAIERCARIAGGDNYNALLYGVTTRGSSWYKMHAAGRVFCGRDQYYNARAKFFYLLNLAL